MQSLKKNVNFKRSRMVPECDLNLLCKTAGNPKPQARGGPDLFAPWQEKTTGAMGGFGCCCSYSTCALDRARTWWCRWRRTTRQALIEGLCKTSWRPLLEHMK